MNGPSPTDGEFVLSLDLGTTTLRAFIYDQNGTIKGCDTDKVSRKKILHFFYKYVFLE